MYQWQRSNTLDDNAIAYYKADADDRELSKWLNLDILKEDFIHESVAPRRSERIAAKVNH